MTLIVGITIVTDIAITNINNTNIIVLITVATIARNASISPHTRCNTHNTTHEHNHRCTVRRRCFMSDAGWLKRLRLLQPNPIRAMAAVAYSPPRYGR